MAQTQSAQGPSDPDANEGGMPDVPEMWGNGGLVGDGRYRLTHRLGRGGMAEVFAAEDVRLGRTVAVKLLRADLAEDPVSKARFTREAQSVAGLNHHAVVAVYDSGEDTVGRNVVPYIVMELVEGRTIRDLLLNAEAPPPEQALIIVSGVLEALAYSHQHGIVHRDIKPANVIITNSGAVKVMDFGIARALHGAASTMTQTGMVMGTPQYLSPEQALGKTVDARSDLYATGCLLYELLALRPPFTGETPLSVVYQHVQDMPVAPSQVLGSVPPELDGLVMRSLAKDPDDRFQSAEEMRGLVQYALQMLHDAGAHTGAWDTGPIDHAGGATQVLGAVGGQHTTAMQHPQHGNTSQQPILPPRHGDDGGFDGYGGNGGRGRGGGKGRMLLIAAVVAIVLVAGVVYAVKSFQTSGGQGGKPSKDKVSTGPSTPGPSGSESPDSQKSPSSGHNGTTGDTGRQRDSDSQDDTTDTGEDTGRHRQSRQPSAPPSGGSSPSSGASSQPDPSSKPSSGGDDKPGTSAGTTTGQSGSTGTTTGQSGTVGNTAGQGGGPAGTTPGG